MIFYIESSTSEEQARFIKENDQQTFTVVLEAFLNRKEKIKGNPKYGAKESFCYYLIPNLKPKSY